LLIPLYRDILACSKEAHAMKAISLRLETEQYERLRLMSFVNRKPMSELLRDAVDDYLSKHPVKPGQEWFWTAAWQEAERAVEAELAAGRHETYDTMEDFLAGLE
jgi:predicted transcriptional regulator